MHTTQQHNIKSQLITYLVISFLSFFSWGQDWEVLPDMGYFRPIVKSGSLASIDGTLFVCSDTNTDVNVQDIYQVVYLENSNWKFYNKFGLGIDSINFAKITSWRDSILVIGYKYFDGTTPRERIELHYPDSIHLLTDFETNGERINRHEDMVSPKDNWLLYVDGNTYAHNPDSASLIRFDGATKHVITSFPHGSGNTVTADHFMSVGDAGHYNGVPMIYQNVLDNPSQSFWDETDHQMKKLPYIDRNKTDGASYPGGAIFCTKDVLGTNTSNPTRKIVRYLGVNIVEVGEPDMETVRFVETKGSNAYFMIERTSSNGNFQLEKFDGLSYTVVNQQTLQAFQINHLGDTLFSNVPVDLHIHKGYMYGFGYIGLIDSIDTAYGVVRLPLIDPQNSAPTAADDFFTVLNDTSITRLHMRANDMDAEDDYLYSEVLSVQQGSVTIHPSEDFVYTPAFGFVGKDTIYYRIHDIAGLSDTAMIVVEVLNEVSEEIHLENDLANVIENGNVIFDVSVNDIYGSQSHFVSLVDSTLHGALMFQSNGQVNYTPNANFAGLDSFEYEVCRSYGWCKRAWAVIDVELINEAPIVSDEEIGVFESPKRLFVMSNDVDLDDDDVLSFTVIQGPFHPGASITGTQVVSLDYENPDVLNLVRDSIQYEVCDQWGACATGWAKIYGNRAPQAVDDLVTISQESTNISVLQNDSDPDNHNLSVTIGQTFVSPSATVSQCGQGCIRYKNPSFEPVENERIQYFITDEYGKMDSAEIIINSVFLGIEGIQLEQITLYPNPTKKELHVSGINAQASIEIYDVSGKLVEKASIANNQGVNVEHLEAGMYLVKVASENQVWKARFEKID